MNKTLVELLHSIDILSSLTNPELEFLYTHMKVEDYNEGEALFNEGDTGEHMYIILSGSVSISVNTPDGENLEIAEISEGNFFGEMSIFDRVVRSATCSPKCYTKVLSLGASDFFEFIKNKPLAGSIIMQKMLNITTKRLQSTGTFLSDMVTWGEAARRRAITDDFTGLYNRRFLDEVIENRISESLRDGESLSYAMIDLDNFGLLNNKYGQETGDKVILSVTEVFKRIFTKTDIITRYGGDEFIVIFPRTTGSEAFDICKNMLEEIRKIEFMKNSDRLTQKITASVGVVSVPENGDSAFMIRYLADKALYMAKDAGRDMVVLWETSTGDSFVKTRIASIGIRNRIIDNIIGAIIKHDTFLVMGHKNPDEDCISSMIAISLLLNKFSKTVYLLIPRKINKNYQYLLNICRYNAIELLYNDEKIPDGISTLFFMDTPKPEMRESFPDSHKIYNNSDILKIEIDHHLGADSRYIGLQDYCLVDEASSASELVGMMAFKLKNKKDIIKAHNINDIFSRNFVLAVLTGIIGDSKMGKYLKTRREKWFYSLFSSMFNEMLTKKTHKHSKNFSTMKEVFTELQQLSKQEDECFTLMMAQKVSFSSKIGTVIVNKEIVHQMASLYDHETIVSVARYAADSLAEYTHLLSLVVYYDDNESSNLIQFRIRRSHSFKALDLRTILELFNMKNGGGHPGAIGFRIPEPEIRNIEEYVKRLIIGIEKLISK